MLETLQRTESVKVLLADDNPIYATGCALALACYGIEVIGDSITPADIMGRLAAQSAHRFDHLVVSEEECYASPAMVHGQIFIRTLHHLYCIGAGERERAQE